MEASPQQVATPLTDDQRKEMLAKRMQSFTGNGYRVESQTDFSVTFVKGRRPNHLLHLILSVLTLGLWLFVWIGVAIMAGEKRRVLTIDAYGRITG